MNKHLIITANIGNRDRLWPISNKFDSCDYLYFTDSPENADGWDTRESFQFSTIDGFSDRRNAKLYKVLAPVMFPGYDYIVWHDSHKLLIVDPPSIIEEYGDFDLLLFKHPERDCVYDEMTHVANLGRRLDVFENIHNQYKFYESCGMPKKYGLHEMTMFIAKPSNNVKQLMLMWWEQICKFGSRDQFSFEYCLWKLGGKIKIKQFEGQTRCNKYFIQHGEHIN